jgi:hypothetical protein
MKEFVLFLRVILNPIHWYCRPKVNKCWDKIVRELINEQADITISQATNKGLLLSFNPDVYKLGDVYINLETSSDFFGCSRDGNTFITSGVGISRRTKILLRKYIEDASYREYRKQFTPLRKTLK